MTFSVVSVNLRRNMYRIFYRGNSFNKTCPMAKRTFISAMKYSTNQSTDLKAVLEQKIEIERKRVIGVRKAHGKKKISEVTVAQVYGGMRGVTCLLCDTSSVDLQKGVTFRGHSIPDLQKKLPRASGGEQPLPEGIFWLLMTGEIPNDAQVKKISEEWNKRGTLPPLVIEVLKQISKLHPMSQLSSALTLLNSESLFLEAYNKGVHRRDYWKYYFEDAMNCIAKTMTVAAHIYVNSFKGGKLGTADPSKDWSHNFCTLCGYNSAEFIELMRLYFTIHCDHEGGNVSAHTVHLVGSALSDSYLSFSAGMQGLAGPLHGLANQEVLMWLQDFRKNMGDNYTKKQLEEFCWKTLKAGRVIPGYGHAVIRAVDPRYTCQREFAQKYFPTDPLFKLVSDIFETVPGILKSLGKVANPWPNVDAHSGVMLTHYGMTEMSYYTVLFGVSRAIGTMTSLMWHRALVIPIERPKSVSTDAMINQIGWD